MANPLGINGHERRGRPIADELRRQLFANDRAKLKLLVLKLTQLALAGEAWAAQLVLDRIDGKVPQPIGGSDELGPTKLQIEWKFSDPNGLPAQPEPAALAAEPGVQLLDCKPVAEVIDLTHEPEPAEPPR